MTEPTMPPAAPALLCLGCIVERHNGQRTEANPGVTVVNGQLTCLEHLQIADGPVLPDRTASGLLLPGQAR